MSPDLSHLRERIDELDREFVRVVAARLAVCEEVAEVKRTTGAAVIQPTRVREVITSRRQLAIDAGVDPDFAEQLFRVLLAETHRIEVVTHRGDAAPDKAAAPGDTRSGIDTVATRIDHVVVAVDDLTSAVDELGAHFGFHRHPLAGGEVTGVVALVAGGVTLVLVGPEASLAVADYLRRHGSGVQHLAIDVLNARFAQSCLTEADAALLTDVLVDDDGHEQFFAARSTTTGVQFGFISRTGHRVGISAAHILALFDALAQGPGQTP